MPWQRGGQNWSVMQAPVGAPASDPPFYDAQVDGLQNFGNYTSQFWGPTQFLNAGIFASGQPWTDVLAFGADPTGVLDSTAAFAAAAGIGMAPRVFIPAGTYLVNGWKPTQVNGWWHGAGQNITIIKTSTAAPVLEVGISTTGNNQYRFSDFTLNGTGVATYGILLDDPTYYGRFSHISITGCGVGISNVNHAFSMCFDYMIINGNGVGAQVQFLAQQTLYQNSFIIANTTAQVEIGDGTTAVPGPVTFNNCQVSMTQGTITTYNIIIKSATLVNLISHYSEVTSNTASGDISIASSSAAVNALNCIGCNSNGNTVGPSKIIIQTGVTGTRLMTHGNHDAGYTGNVIVDNGTSSNVRRICVLENTTWINDSFNGTALVYP